MIRTTRGREESVAQPTRTVLVVDSSAGVRAGLRWLVRVATAWEVAGEAQTVAEARPLAADVVLTGVTLPDGVAADLCGAGRPLVVHTWLPDDEREAAETAGAAAVVRHGRLMVELACALDAALGGRPYCSEGADPDLDSDAAGGADGNR